MGRNVKKRGAGADMSVYGQGGGQGTSDPNELYTDLATIDTATTTSSAATTTSTATGTAAAHYCEACQKGFALTTAWEAHVATHEGCPHPGCQFSATKKIVGAHWKLVHGQFSGNGLKEIEVEVDGGDKMTFKVLCGTSPEEVREWREERKRLFPSAATVKAKEEERQKLIEAGGVDEQAPKSSRGKVARGRAADKTAGSEGDAAVPSGGEGEEGQEVLEEKEDGTKPQRKHFCQYYTRGKCKNGKDCRYVHDEEAKTEFELQKQARLSMSAIELEEEARSKKAKKGQLFLPKPLTGGDRGTLLKKLLRDEISKEENVILQCFRYLVKNNFLQDNDHHSV